MSQKHTPKTIPGLGKSCEADLGRMYENPEILGHCLIVNKGLVIIVGEFPDYKGAYICRRTSETGIIRDR